MKSSTVPRYVSELKIISSGNDSCSRPGLTCSCTASSDSSRVIAPSQTIVYSSQEMGFYTKILEHRRLATMLLSLLGVHLLIVALAILAIIRFQQFWAIPVATDNP